MTETCQQNWNYWLCVRVCVYTLGDKSVFFHQDPKACDPEGFHGQQSFRWEKPEAELWKPRRQQHHVGCKFIYLYGVIKSGTS